MNQNLHDYKAVKALADEIGAGYGVDPTVTPMMDGDRSILELNVAEATLRTILRDIEQDWRRCGVLRTLTDARRAQRASRRPAQLHSCHSVSPPAVTTTWR